MCERRCKSQDRNSFTNTPCWELTQNTCPHCGNNNSTNNDNSNEPRRDSSQAQSPDLTCPTPWQPNNGQGYISIQYSCNGRNCQGNTPTCNEYTIAKDMLSPCKSCHNIQIGSCVPYVGPVICCEAGTQRPACQQWGGNFQKLKDTWSTVTTFNEANQNCTGQPMTCQIYEIGTSKQPCSGEMQIVLPGCPPPPPPSPPECCCYQELSCACAQDPCGYSCAQCCSPQEDLGCGCLPKKSRQTVTIQVVLPKPKEVPEPEIESKTSISIKRSKPNKKGDLKRKRSHENVYLKASTRTSSEPGNAKEITFNTQKSNENLMLTASAESIHNPYFSEALPEKSKKSTTTGRTKTSSKFEDKEGGTSHSEKEPSSFKKSHSERQQSSFRDPSSFKRSHSERQPSSFKRSQSEREPLSYKSYHSEREPSYKSGLSPDLFSEKVDPSRREPSFEKNRSKESSRKYGSETLRLKNDSREVENKKGESYRSLTAVPKWGSETVTIKPNYASKEVENKRGESSRDLSSMPDDGVTNYVHYVSKRETTKDRPSLKRKSPSNKQQQKVYAVHDTQTSNPFLVQNNSKNHKAKNNKKSKEKNKKKGKSQLNQHKELPTTKSTKQVETMAAYPRPIQQTIYSVPNTQAVFNPFGYNNNNESPEKKIQFLLNPKSFTHNPSTMTNNYLPTRFPSYTPYTPNNDSQYLTSGNYSPQFQSSMVETKTNPFLQAETNSMGGDDDEQCIIWNPWFILLVGLFIIFVIFVIACFCLTPRKRIRRCVSNKPFPFCC